MQRYISELSPSPFRGRLVTVSSLFITGGQVVAYVVGWLFSAHSQGWRWMVGLGAAPAAIQFLVLEFIPETPRWLVKANQKERAKQVLLRVYGGGDEIRKMVDAVLRRVEKEIMEEEEAAGERSNSSTPKTGWRGKLASVNDGFAQVVAVGGNRRALIIACMLQGFQQLCGFVSSTVSQVPHRARFLETDASYTMLIPLSAELPNVLLSNHLLLGWLPLAHPNLPLNRQHKLPLHPRGLL
jgi:SP family myo-inositol transporter-like MFS transporter 13